MEVFLAHKLFVMPGVNDDDYKIVDEVKVFAAYDSAFRQFKQYCGDLSDEIEEGDIENYIKDDDLLYATTFSGKSLKAWIGRQGVIE